LKPHVLVMWYRLMCRWHRLNPGFRTTKSRSVAKKWLGRILMLLLSDRKERSYLGRRAAHSTVSLSFTLCNLYTLPSLCLSGTRINKTILSPKCWTRCKFRYLDMRERPDDAFQDPPLVGFNQMVCGRGARLNPQWDGL
jgi:hypothetical protein